MRVRPQNRPVHLLNRMQQVMVVIPINTDQDKTQHIAYKHRQQRRQRFQALAMRHFHFQHHDGDDDRNHAIAKCFGRPLPMLLLLHRNHREQFRK